MRYYFARFNDNAGSLGFPPLQSLGVSAFRQLHNYMVAGSGTNEQHSILYTFLYQINRDAAKKNGD